MKRILQLLISSRITGLPVLLLALALAMVSNSYAAGFTPIPLNPASFNRDVVIEATAPKALSDAVTATMDGGTNKNGNTYFEVGYMGLMTNGLPFTNGIPVHNSFVTNSSGNHYWQMPPDYHTNNAILVGHGNGSKTPIAGPGTLTLVNPGRFQSLSFLTTAGNGPVTINYTINYIDGSTETGTFSALDWFNGAAAVVNGSGRVSMGGALANIDGVGCRLFQADIGIGNSGTIMTSITFTFADAVLWTNGRAVVFAVSGSTDNVNWSPIAVTGYTHDVVVEADAPLTTGGAASYGPVTNQVAGNLTNLVTATMDGGSSRLGNAWYEQGFYRGIPSTGIPPAGSTFHSATIPATYTMPSTYVGSCAVFVATNITTGNITFATPGSYGALSFLCASANGDTFVPCTIQFQDGSVENNVLFIPDWFDRNIPWSWRSFGRVTPSNHTINSSPDQFVDPFASGLGTYDYRGLTLPAPQLMDSVINITNSGGIITNIVLTYTNLTPSTHVSAVFAVSGAPAGNVPPVFGVSGTATPGQPNNAPVNGISLIKRFEGTNNIVLAVTNIAGSSISYQWMKALRGGGLRDKFYSFDYSTFSNVTDGGRVSGSSTSVLVISNALVADSADYLVVASNPYGAITSTVATVEMFTTNRSLLVGVPLGDTIASYTPDGAPAAESVDHVGDQVEQKWLSYSLNNQVLPFLGPVGYIATPVSGASIVTGMRFYCANDTTGRDPFDYFLEGSNDGETWNPITGGQLKGTLSLPTARGGTGSAPLESSITNAVTEVDFANVTGYSSYRVSITNIIDDYGTPLMQVAEIQLLGTLVPNPPVWVRQPDTTTTVFVGGSPVAYAVASGNPAPRYQWFKNGTTLIAGATSSAYAFPNAQLSDTGTTLSCVASNSFGSITSSLETLTVIAAPTQPYPVSVLANNPIAYFRLNETPDDGAGDDGVTTHDYVGGHNGYYTNANIGLPGYNPVADSDTSAEFGLNVTANSYVAEINDIDFSRAAGATAAFSIEAWAYGGDQTVSDSAIVTKGYNGILTAGTGTGTEQFVLDVSGGSPRKFRFLVRDALGNARVVQSAVTPFDPISGMPTWHHLLGVCDQPNGNIYFYVDGQLAGTTAMPNSVGILAQPLAMTIGARKSSGSNPYDNQWAGYVDEVAVYNTALSASQALSHYEAAQRAPIISLEPINITTNANTSVTLASSAYGFGTVSYQWYLSDGVNPTVPVSGATSPNLTFIASPAQNGNYYQVVVSNSAGSTTSVVAQLVVYSGVPGFSQFKMGVQTDLNAADTFTLGHVITLSVNPSGTSPFTYVWKKNGATITDDYRTSGSSTTTLTIGYAAPGDSGNYQVFVSNGSGTTPSTLDVVTITTVVAPPAINATTNGWTFNTGGTGAPNVGMAANKITLTADLGNTESSAWVNTPIPVGAFNATFVYQDVAPGVGGADGVTFCLQNVGLSALGGGGGSLGYNGIASSFCLAFNIYQPNTYGIAVFSGGGGNAAGAYTPANPVLVGQNTDQIRTDITYDGTTFTTKLTDLTTAATFTMSTNVNIPSLIGSGTAYVGFTGADGGVDSTQTISSFSMFNPPSLSITATKVGSNIVLSWPVTVGGAYLLSSPTLGATAVWNNDTVDTFRVVGTQANVTVSPGSGNQFFRLQVFP